MSGQNRQRHRWRSEAACQTHDPQCRQIILDISDVSFVDGSGLGTLVGLKLSAGSVAYCNLEFLNSSPAGDGITAYDEAEPVPLVR